MEDVTWPISATAVSGSTYTVALPELTSGGHQVWCVWWTRRATDPHSRHRSRYSSIPQRYRCPTLQRWILAPTPVLSATRRTSVRRPVIRGTAKPSSIVEVYDGLVLLGEVATNAEGSFSFATAQDLVDGMHEMRVRQVDAVGNASEKSDPLNLYIRGPVLGRHIFYNNSKWDAHGTGPMAIRRPMRSTTWPSRRTNRRCSTVRRRRSPTTRATAGASTGS